MQKRKHILCCCVVLVLLLVLSSLQVFAADDPHTPTNTEPLRFREDGTFKILQFADTQDCFWPRPAMIAFMNHVLDLEQPDLVIFTGDNIDGFAFMKPLAKQSIRWIVEPVESRGIPFTATFGNHDDEALVSKETQFAMYREYSQCLMYDPDPSLSGCASHNLPIQSADGSKTAFNLWIMDSNTYDADNKDYYDCVHADQIAWYEETSQALRAENGGVAVPSMLFQHIIVPEIYNVMHPASAGLAEDETHIYQDVAYEMNFAPQADATGTIGEFPCSPVKNEGQFTSWKKQGDIVAAVFGHDHVNSYIAKYDGIDLIQSPSMSFKSYGDDMLRGSRVIVLDEVNPQNYQTYVRDYSQVLQAVPGADWWLDHGRSIASAFTTARLSIAKPLGRNDYVASYLATGGNATRDSILHFDWAIFSWVETHLWNNILNPIMIGITSMGDGGIVWIALGIVLLFFKKYRKYGFMVLIGLLFSLMINDWILKPWIARPRPFDLELPWWQELYKYPDLIKRPSSWSFPSGHTSSSFAAAAALWFTKKKRLIIPSSILAVLIAFSRIYVHVHYPTDVIAGVIVGILYGLLAALLVRKLWPILQPKAQAVWERRRKKASK